MEPSIIGIGDIAPLEPYVCCLNGVNQATSKEFAIEFEKQSKELEELREWLSNCGHDNCIIGCEDEETGKLLPCDCGLDELLTKEVK